MRAENSCAPASRSEPEREALQRAEGRTCGSQGCRPSCSCRRRRRRCQRRLKSDSRKSRERRTPRLSQTSACARLTVSGPSSQAYPTKVLTYTLTTSKVAYFKRKYAEEEDLHQDYHGYFPKHLILPEDRTCILKLSLEKLRFLEDPETYLRRSVLINNLLRKIHLETEKESYEYFKGAPCYKTAYSDARKRLKFMVQECCSQSLYYEELHSYHIVPYASENAIYGMGYTSSHLEQNSQLLIYKMN